MTTGNAVETFGIKDALYIPLEALSSEEGVSYVYKRDGGRILKQEVETGAMNDDEVVIVRGLAADEQVLLSPPAGSDEIETVNLPGTGDRPKAKGGDSAEGPTPVPVNPAPPPSPAEKGATRPAPAAPAAPAARTPPTATKS